MKRFLLSLLLIVGSVSISLAQNPVVTQTYSATGYISANSIRTTNTFELVLAASTSTTGRTDCLIQNNGAAAMALYFGDPTGVVSTNGYQLSAGSVFRCANSGIVIRNAIYIIGTAGQKYFFINE